MTNPTTIDLPFSPEDVKAGKRVENPLSTALFDAILQCDNMAHCTWPEPQYLRAAFGAIATVLREMRYRENTGRP